MSNCFLLNLILGVPYIEKSIFLYVRFCNQRFFCVFTQRCVFGLRSFPGGQGLSIIFRFCFIVIQRPVFGLRFLPSGQGLSMILCVCFMVIQRPVLGLRSFPGGQSFLVFDFDFDFDFDFEVLDLVDFDGLESSRDFSSFLFTLLIEYFSASSILLLDGVGFDVL